MIKDIYKPKLAEILPESIKNDEQVHAAAVALDAELEKLLDKVKLVLHLPRLDELPADVLDHLAFQFHCDFYRNNLPVEVKRNQIRESLLWHRIKGTPRGVELAIADFMTDAVVEENWQYGGEPYFFRIVTKGLKYLSTEQEFLDLVNSAKNVRSWLEGIIFDLTVEQPHSLVTAVAELDSTFEVTDFFLPVSVEKQNLVQGVAELESGIEITDLIGGIVQPTSTLYQAIAQLEYGIEITELEELPPIDDYWFERWIAERWREWSLNPAIKYYTHPGDEIFPPEPDVFPDGDFLRLYFQFPNKSIRYLTMLNPRDNLTDRDIKSAGVWFNDLLMNQAGYTSIRNFKALLVKNERWKIL